MSQRTLKSQRRYIRKLQRDSYEATIKSLAVGTARQQVLASFMKPKPRYMPQFLWHRIVRAVLDVTSKP